jgi:6-phosphogluconolactonase
MAFDVMLQHLSIPINQIYRMEGELEPKDAAKAYQDRLKNFFQQRPPRIDLILLGLGNDCHTASIFPGSSAISENRKWVMANYVRKLSAWRLTMTSRLINQAANVTFLVSGKGKAEAVQRVLASRFTPEELPAQLIRPERGQLRWMLDQAAAKLL